MTMIIRLFSEWLAILVEFVFTWPNTNTNKLVVKRTLLFYCYLCS